MVNREDLIFETKKIQNFEQIQQYNSFSKGVIQNGYYVYEFCKQ